MEECLELDEGCGEGLRAAGAAASSWRASELCMTGRVAERHGGEAGSALRYVAGTCAGIQMGPPW